MARAGAGEAAGSPCSGHRAVFPAAKGASLLFSHESPGEAARLPEAERDIPERGVQLRAGKGPEASAEPAAAPGAPVWPGEHPAASTGFYSLHLSECVLLPRKMGN